MPARPIFRTVLPLVLALVAGAGDRLFAQTRQFLDAPVVTSQIRVAWNADTKKVTYAVDGDTVFRALTPDKLFLARTAFFVTYPRINPLRVQATASATAVEDPAQATIAQLLEAIVDVGTIVHAAGSRAAPTEGTGVEGQPCAALTIAHRRISALTEALYGPEHEPVVIRQQVAGWVEAIDAAYAGVPPADGPAAVRAGVQRIDGFVDDLAGAVESARTALARIETEASDVAGEDVCAMAVSTAYHLALLSNPGARIEELVDLRAAARNLRDTLTRDYIERASRWIDAVNYQVGPEIAPTPARMQTVVVRMATLTPHLSSSSGLAFTEVPVEPATLTVRRYSPVTPEVGLGVVFGFPAVPKYGTAKNAAGATIVARAPDTRVVAVPAMLVNFVCRCQSGPFLAPMLQVGVATSTEVPAILLGGGIRLFGAGKGDVAIGAGVLAGWVKDLRSLGEGQIVAGTRDIEADLRYAPRRRGYFVIQYNF